MSDTISPAPASSIGPFIAPRRGASMASGRATRPFLSVLEADGVRTALAAIILTLLFVTFEPYQAAFTGAAGSGNTVNQIGYSALALLGLLAHLTVTPRSAVGSLMRPTWILTAFWLLQSATHSIMPDASLRAVLFSLAAMLAMTAVLCLPADARGFRRALATAALAVLALSYFGVFLLPSAGVHGAGGVEPQHVGLWRGIYSHKNVAGPMMAALFFAGLYLWRCGSVALGGLIALLSLIFVAHAGSKTTATLLPAVAFLVLFGRLLGGRLLPVAVFAVVFSGMALMTLGTVLVPALYDFLQWVLPGTTFTGRLDLWRFALDVLGERGWTGMGFEAFWGTQAVLRAEPSMELSWDPRGIVNAHNGYLDLAIALGWPGMALGVLMIVVLPLADFARAGRGGKDDVRLADFFLMILAFVLLNAFLESYLFTRGNPIWMAAWMAIAGLRLLAVRADLPPERHGTTHYAVRGTGI